MSVGTQKRAERQGKCVKSKAKYYHYILKNRHPSLTNSKVIEFFKAHPVAAKYDRGEWYLSLCKYQSYLRLKPLPNKEIGLFLPVHWPLDGDSLAN